MKYNTNLYHRRSIRLKNYDYSKSGSYFITICTEDRLNIFGEIFNGKMSLNQYGFVVDECISKIGKLYKNVGVKCKIVMPNHVHFIIEILGVAYDATQDGNSGNINQIEIHQNRQMQQKSKMQLPKVIQQFKSASVKLCKNIGAGLHDMQPLRWQRNYYEHIIRNEKSYWEIREYIDTNPLKWEQDRYYLG